MLKKSDLLTGLLEHRNTPPQGMTFSPAQRFLCRRTKSSLPVSESLLRPSVPPVTVVRDEHPDRRAKAKSYYDKTASKELTPLVPGQFVYRKPNDHHPGERWNFGEVLNEVTPRSYLIKTPDGLVRRNRSHLSLLRLRFHVISNLSHNRLCPLSYSKNCPLQTACCFPSYTSRSSADH